MPTELEMKDVLRRYLDSFNAGDVDGILALFAPDAVVEDPYGNEPVVGLDDLRKFYEFAMTFESKLTLDAPVRASHGSAAAMALTSTSEVITIGAISVMEFDSDGRVTSIKAYWGTTDNDAEQ
ncbi:nuclear transport factor 2 family protein [Nocardia vermiculata]|uniref:SnoaL-like domain-containing protein n=1 Tax=Nocardia vermiculata TaxID=257274 RepID=A0A846Y008_9NOCA|nr:nuclear transport factor 2 family protein [Nocardia vermiculata]NKY52187.1 SnoaL-like domain-containing protein [Nocardia vermiculata]